MLKFKDQFSPKNKIIKNLLFLLIFLLIACGQVKEEEKIDYCERFKSDQSNLRRDYMSESEKEKRLKSRKADFQKNWEIVKHLIKTDDLSTVGKDTCYNKFILATLIHNAQLFPKEVFNKPMIDKIQKEVDKGNIAVWQLRTALSFYKNHTDDKSRCKDLKAMVDYAIKTWQVNENFEESISGKIEGIEYVDCKNK